MKQIFCQIGKCLACRSCELACAVAHSQSNNLVDAIREETPPGHRIQVQLIDESRSPHPQRAIALQCRHCDVPPCIQACISGGIYKDPKTGDVLIDADKCVACWSCVMVCPFGAIALDEGLHRPIKCDHCPDREAPACVEACPTGALIHCEPEELDIKDLRKRWL